MQRWVRILTPLLAGLSICILFVHDVSITSSTGYSDFVQDYVSAREWHAGDDAYGLTRPALRQHLAIDSNDIRQGHRNPHPPFQVVILSPLARLDYRAARLALLGLSALIALAAAVVFLREIGRPGWWGLGVLALPILHAEFFYGQLIVLSLLMFVLAWRSLQRGNDVAAGAFLGIAAALKLFPVLMLLPLLRSRRYRAAAWLVLAAGGSTLLASALVGFRPAWHWLTLAFPQNSSNFADSASPGSWLFRAFGYSTWLALLAGTLCAVMAWRSSYWKAVPWVILASPIVWAGYGILALPLIAMQAPIIAGVLIAVLSLAVNPLVTAGLLFLGLFGVEPARDAVPRVIDLRRDVPTQLVRQGSNG